MIYITFVEILISQGLIPVRYPNRLWRRDPLLLTFSRLPYNGKM